MRRRTRTAAVKGLAGLLTLLIAAAGAPFRAATVGGASAPLPAGPAGGGAVRVEDHGPSAPQDAEPSGDEMQEAEAPTGVYRGTVTDRRSGKPVANATLVFINEETGESTEVATDAEGRYETRLPAGEYVVDIRVKKKTYRSAGTFREEAEGKRWVMDFTIGTKLTEKDLKISTSPSDIRVVPTEPRPPLEPSKKWWEMLIFIGGVLAIGAAAD